VLRTIRKFHIVWRVVTLSNNTIGCLLCTLVYVITKRAINQTEMSQPYIVRESVTSGILQLKSYIESELKQNKIFFKL